MKKMNDKKGTKLAAVIEIEPTFAKLKLSQLKKGKPDDLENLESSLRIGSEICSSGKIGPENFRELAKILRGYGKIIQDYGAETCPVIAGHELLSAENHVFVLERLRSRSGCTPKTHGFGVENALICQEAMRSSGIQLKESRGSVIVAVVGSGTVGVTVFTDGRVVSVHAFPAGPLKLNRLFSTIQDMPDLAEAAEEYLDRLFAERFFPKPENGAKPLLILTGHDAEAVNRLCGAQEKQRLEPEKVGDLFERMRDLTPDRIGLRFDMTEEAAGRLYFTLAAARSLIKTASPSAALVLRTDLTDALIRQLLFQKERGLFQNHARENAVSCARKIAQKAGKNLAHAEFVRKLSCKIFERMQKEYGLDGENKLALELSAILNGCCRSVESEEIYGIEAGISELIPTVLRELENPPDHKPISEKELAALRISAILGVAEALDFSGRQKLENIRAKVEKDKLNITAESREGTALEKWVLENRAAFFTEVFGLAPELTVKFAGTVR